MRLFVNRVGMTGQVGLMGWFVDHVHCISSRWICGERGLLFGTLMLDGDGFLGTGEDGWRVRGYFDGEVVTE